MTRKEIETVNKEIPSYLATGEREVIEVENLVVPNVVLTQSLSTVIQDGSIPDIKAGDFYNTMTSEIYGTSFTFIPVFFKRSFIVCQENGTYVTRCDTGIEASKYAIDNGIQNPNIQETHSHYGFVELKNGTLAQVCLKLTRTKLMQSKLLNTLILNTGVPRGGVPFVISSKKVKSKHGFYYGISVAIKAENNGNPIYVNKKVFDSVKWFKKTLEAEVTDPFV